MNACTMIFLFVKYKFSKEHIENEVITLTSETPSYENHFEKNSKPNFLQLIKVSKTRRKIEKMKVKQHIESSIFLSEHIEN